MRLPATSLLKDAVQRACALSEWPADWPWARCKNLTVGIWGRQSPWQHALRDGDRVELYRPLRVDPKVARRERFGQQGARTSGLFAKKRPGAAAGY